MLMHWYRWKPLPPLLARLLWLFSSGANTVTDIWVLSATGKLDPGDIKDSHWEFILLQEDCAIPEYDRETSRKAIYETQAGIPATKEGVWISPELFEFQPVHEHQISEATEELSQDRGKGSRGSAGRLWLCRDDDRSWNGQLEENTCVCNVSFLQSSHVCRVCLWSGAGNLR